MQYEISVCTEHREQNGIMNGRQDKMDKGICVQRGGKKPAGCTAVRAAEVMGRMAV